LNRAGFIAPGGVAVDDDGMVWVADFFTVRAFESRRDPVISWYDRFDPPFAGPANANTVSVDGDTLITTGWFSNSVQVLDAASGEVLEDIRTLAVPVNAIGFNDALAVAQVGAGNVIDARTGAVLVDGLAYPLGLATDGAVLYVSDRGSGHVWAVTDEGPEELATGLSSPEGLALDGDRLLVVEEGRDRVIGIDLTTGAVTSVIEGLDLGSRVVPAALPHFVFNGVAVGSDQSIYVTSDGANAVYQFRR
jgi:sugar lactone lactonase YvrE